MFIKRQVLFCLVFSRHNKPFYLNHRIDQRLRLVTLLYNCALSCKMPKHKAPTKAKAKAKAPTQKEKHLALLKTLEIFDAVAVLPMELQNVQKVWFNRCIIEFGLRLGSRGSKEDNGTTYTHDQFVNQFCDEMHPELTPEEREQYYLIIGPVSRPGIIIFQSANVTRQKESLPVFDESSQAQNSWN